MERVTKDIYRWLGHRELTPEEIEHTKRMVKESETFLGIKTRDKQTQ